MLLIIALAPGGSYRMQLTFLKALVRNGNRHAPLQGEFHSRISYVSVRAASLLMLFLALPSHFWRMAFPLIVTMVSIIYTSWFGSMRAVNGPCSSRELRRGSLYPSFYGLSSLSPCLAGHASESWVRQLLSPRPVESAPTSPISVIVGVCSTFSRSSLSFFGPRQEI